MIYYYFSRFEWNIALVFFVGNLLRIYCNYTCYDADVEKSMNSQMDVFKVQSGFGGFWLRDLSSHVFYSFRFVTMNLYFFPLYLSARYITMFVSFKVNFCLIWLPFNWHCQNNTLPNGMVILGNICFQYFYLLFWKKCDWIWYHFQWYQLFFWIYTARKLLVNRVPIIQNLNKPGLSSFSNIKFSIRFLFKHFVSLMLTKTRRNQVKTKTRGQKIIKLISGYQKNHVYPFFIGLCCRKSVSKDKIHKKKATINNKDRNDLLKQKRKKKMK